MKYCNICGLSEKMPNITFDPNGICNYCYKEKIRFKGEEQLLKLIESSRNPNKRYDCMIPLSGGRDSSYTLLKLVKDYNLNVLAVNYANPFTDPIAKKNIKEAVDRLNVNLVQFKLPNNLHEMTFRYNLKILLRNPNPALIPMLCVACKTIWLPILKIAKKEKINCIISGGNPYEETSFKKELLNVGSEEKVENSFIKCGVGILRETIKNPAYYNPVFIPTLIKGYLFGDPYCLGSKVYGWNISRIDLFHYLEWNENEIISRIRNELSWESPQDLSSTWRFDCLVGHLKEYLYQKLIGVTERDDFYAKLVRQGLMTRADALTRLEKENRIQYNYIKKIFELAEIDENLLF